MPTIMVRDGTGIVFKDRRSGQPIVFRHGWPLSADDPGARMMFFPERGHRVVAQDRRGHRPSSRTGTGHDMDTHIIDLAAPVAAPEYREYDPCRPFHRQREGSALCRAAWRGPRREGGPDQRRRARYGAERPECRRRAEPRPRLNRPAPPHDAQADGSLPPGDASGAILMRWART